MYETDRHGLMCNHQQMVTLQHTRVPNLSVAFTGPADDVPLPAQVRVLR